jgi:hypothetical protein
MTQPIPVPAIAAVPEKPLRKTQSNKITDVKITLGFNSPSGRHEAQYVIPAEDFIIDSYAVADEEKVMKAKGDSGEFIGFEPTGEHVLTLKIKYHTNDP